MDSVTGVFKDGGVFPFACHTKSKKLLKNGGTYDTIMYIIRGGLIRLSKIEKLRAKFFSKPVRNDMTFDEITTLAESYGCKIQAGGKHIHIVHVESGRVIPIPRHDKTVGVAYIKQVRELFDTIVMKEEQL